MAGRDRAHATAGLTRGEAYTISWKTAEARSNAMP